MGVEPIPSLAITIFTTKLNRVPRTVDWSATQAAEVVAQAGFEPAITAETFQFIAVRIPTSATVQDYRLKRSTTGCFDLCVEKIF